MARRLMGPFARVEGHLEIELSRNDTLVLDAKVNAPLYRGMETVMLGHPPEDALTIAPRICGICSVAQSVGAAKALRSTKNYELVPNAQLMENLVLSAEMLSNHLSHFYLFFMPDFTDHIYRDEIWFEDAQKYRSEQGEAQRNAIEARTQLLEMMGVLAGKWPHTLCIRPGGSTISLKTADKQKLKITLNRFKRFLERNLLGKPIEEVVAYNSCDDLQNLQGDLGFFINIANSLGLDQTGKIDLAFLSASHLSEGLVHAIHEDLSHSFMAGSKASPREKQNVDFDLEKENAYSWCKAPRLAGEAFEVGAIARHVQDATPFIASLHEKLGSTVLSRIVARSFEMALLVAKMEKWIDEIDPQAPFYEDIKLPDQALGFGALEAARGTLMHWLEIEDQKISNYQIIAPTTWNFSPRDEAGRKGALEMALENAPIILGEEDPINVRHIVRSFDPCMACTVH